MIKDQEHMTSLVNKFKAIAMSLEFLILRCKITLKVGDIERLYETLDL
jgi:hypothetical protein